LSATDFERRIALCPASTRCRRIDGCIWAIRNPVDAATLGSRRHQIEAELLAHNAREEPAHRMLQPSCGFRLRHLLRAYADYYNRTRTHLSLEKDSPVSRAIEPFGRMLPVPILGGLHHQSLRL
jgi:hypothetical protein